MQDNVAESAAGEAGPVRLFLCGDVMTGRGIDQILPHPGAAKLHESFVQSALGYVELAERVNGQIATPVSFEYIWGDALAVMNERNPDCRIINLETSITTSEAWENKGINYRMHPQNLRCIEAARIDCCVLANNHVLDWGPEGLAETLDTLRGAGIATTGAGRNLAAAQAPATLSLGDRGRVHVFAYGLGSSGIPGHWAANPRRPGVNRLARLDESAIDDIASQVTAVKQPGDIAIASIHWGGNWGYEVERSEREFAHRLIDDAEIDIVHGHSSHHARGMEVYAERLILYGCGDFINDYEGIGGREQFRGDLAVAYFPRVDGASGRLLDLDMDVFAMRRFRLNRATAGDLKWLRTTLSRESQIFGTAVEAAHGALHLRWPI